MSGDLQFTRAEFSADTPAHVVCSVCDQGVIQSYYELGGKIVCSSCREKRDRALDGWGGGRFLRSLGAGLAVGLAGAAVWYAIRIWANYELGIISIAIGYGVGRAVNWGSYGKGGWLYQLLAVFVTYSSIVLNYVPDIVQGMTEGAGPATALHYIIGFVIAYAAPFFMGFENFIGILIIAFGLWEAWKLNKRVDAAMTGPYTVTPGAPAAPPAAVAPPAPTNV